MLKTDAFRIRIGGNLCVYCGETAGNISRLAATRSMVSCCLPAENVTASPGHPGRSNYVKSGLRRRYEKHLRAPPWTDREMLPLGPTLKTGVQKWRNETEKAKRRIAWNAISYLSLIDHSNVFVPIFVEVDLFGDSVIPSLKKLFSDERR